MLQMCGVHRGPVIHLGSQGPGDQRHIAGALRSTPNCKGPVIHRAVCNGLVIYPWIARDL